MRVAKYLNPLWYGRRFAYEQQQRRIMKGITGDWRRWAVRRALSPLLMLSCRITTRGGSRFHLGRDPIDDRILTHLCATAVDLFFPPDAAPPGGSLLLDVGAHHGIYAVEALRRYPGTHLIAIDPDPQAHKLLLRNLAENALLDRAEIVRAGIGPCSGEAFLETSAEGSWGNRTTPLSDAGEDARRAGVTVRMATVSEVLRGRTPYLVKCSAEGAEFDLFPQMFEMGVRPDIVIVLIHPHAGRVDDLLGLFQQNGYSVQDADVPPKHARFHCRRSDRAVGANLRPSATEQRT